MERLLVNLTGSTATRILNNRRYIVAPLTLIVPGVLNGSDGALYYPPEEVSKNPTVWNHIPIVVNHPKVDGKQVSARSASVLNQFGIGLILNSRYEDSKLKAEGWFDIDALMKTNSSILMALQRGDEIELSTGLFTKNETANEGDNFNGTPYAAIARNYQPDHLAILTEAKGACSVKDGCGVNVNSMGSKKLIGDTGSNQGHTHTLEVDQDGFGFTSFQDDHFHSIEDFKVKKNFRLKPANGHTHTLDRESLVDTAIRDAPTITNKEEFDMNKKERTKIVNDLVTNCECWEEDDREMLMNFEEEKLTKVHEHSTKQRSQELVVNTATEGFEDQQGNNHTFNAESGRWESKMKIEEKESVENKGGKTKPAKKQEIKLEDLPSEMQEDIKFSRNAKQTYKEELVKKLIANIEDDGTRETQHKRLLGRGLEELEMDVKLLPEPIENKDDHHTRPSYFGQATPMVNQQSIEKPGPLGLPVWDFDQES
jgi:hypothetical protein